MQVNTTLLATDARAQVGQIFTLGFFVTAKARKGEIASKLESVKASGLKWWQIAGGMLLTLATGATGAGAIGLVKNKRLAGALSVARDGLRMMAGAIETGKGNDCHETAVYPCPSGYQASPLNR